MKKSIRRQIATVFIALVSVILMIAILINSFFLESFYVRNKQASLIEIYSDMNQSVKKGTLSNDETLETLSAMAEVGNISFVIANDTNNEVISGTPNNVRTQELFTQLMGYRLGRNQMQGELLESSEQYQIHSAKDVIRGGEYIEMWGYIDNGYAFILRSPLDSIRESVMISNENRTR